MVQLRQASGWCSVGRHRDGAASAGIGMVQLRQASGTWTGVTAAAVRGPEIPLPSRAYQLRYQRALAGQGTLPMADGCRNLMDGVGAGPGSCPS